MKIEGWTLVKSLVPRRAYLIPKENFVTTPTFLRIPKVGWSFMLRTGTQEYGPFKSAKLAYATWRLMT